MDLSQGRQFVSGEPGARLFQLNVPSFFLMTTIRCRNPFALAPFFECSESDKLIEKRRPFHWHIETDGNGECIKQYIDCWFHPLWVQMRSFKACVYDSVPLMPSLGDTTAREVRQRVQARILNILHEVSDRRELKVVHSKTP